MSRYYSPEFLKELKDASNIVDVISSYIQVEKIGYNHLAQCPFHEDNTPSLQINPENNTFYCHACGAGSKNHSHVKECDVLSFLRHINGVSFPEAVEALSQMTGIPLPALSPAQQAELEKKRQQTELMNTVADAFHYNLKEDQKSLQYLGNRGITQLDMDIWKLGFGGEHPHQAFANVKNKIVFTMYDYHGNIISFTGRVPFSSEVLKQINEKNKLEGKTFIPKYKDMHGFDKNNHLYGMHIAKDYIRESKTAVLVEGWTDVISLHRHGVKHSVSTMGVALSQQQISLLKRAGVKKVILMRDGDEAGVLAAERDSKLLAEHSIECYIYPLEDGMDPDTLCLSFGYYNESLIHQINKLMQPIGQYKITKIYKQTQDDILYHYGEINQTQQERLDKVIEVLLTIHDPAELDIYIRQISDLMVISYDTIKEKIYLKRNSLMKESAVQQSQIETPAFQSV